MSRAPGHLVRAAIKERVMKKLIAGIGMAGIALMGLTASASSIGTVSGGSTAASVSNFSTNWTIDNNNNATLSSSVGAKSLSGDNNIDAALDQNNTTLTTGGSQATVLVDNAANSNHMTIAADAVGGPASTIGLVTGGSTASFVLGASDTMAVVNTNTVHNEDFLNSSSKTGNNHISAGLDLNNTSVTTGGTDAGAGLTNSFNVNIKSITRTLKFP